MLNVNWTQFKSFITSRGLSIQWLDLEDTYHLLAYDGLLILETQLNKKLEETEILDFETNFKANGNKKLESLDSDGTSLNRVKITTTGWHYQLHGLEFETSKLNSNYSKRVDNSNYGFSSMKFYKLVSESEVEIAGDDLNQTYLDANCVKTIIDWEPTHDVEIIGGMLKQSTGTTEDIRLWVVGVPDVSEAYGGSKPFTTNINLKYIGIEEGVKVDGRAPKFLAYNATYHTSKIRLIFRHPAGHKHKLHMVFELFKA